jgi:hypothetical protein
LGGIPLSAAVYGGRRGLIIANSPDTALTEINGRCRLTERKA